MVGIFFKHDFFFLNIDESAQSILDEVTEEGQDDAYDFSTDYV